MWRESTSLQLHPPLDELFILMDYQTQNGHAIQINISHDPKALRVWITIAEILTLSYFSQ